MTTRQMSFFVALAGTLMLSACSSDETNPGTNSKCISSDADLIARFDTDNGIAQVDGRSGGFYVYGDDSIKGTFEPAKQDNYPIDPDNGNPECSDKGSFHTKATGFGVWGAAVGTDFAPKTETNKKGTYDASKYKGVSFWAKAGAPLKGVQVSFPDVWTDAGADPSTIDSSAFACVYSAMQPEYNCSPYLVKLGLTDFPEYMDMQIDTEWKRFDIMFEHTQQDVYNEGFHRPDADYLDTEHLTAMAIQVNAIYEGGQPRPNDFEIWVDDIYFIK